MAVAAAGVLAALTVGVPFLLGGQSYSVLTGSMRPTLEPGALIVTRATAIEDVRVGDVVTFQLRSGEPEVATHRVVGVGESVEGDRLLVTKGDANDVVDAQPVQREQVRGVVIYSLPLLGYVNVWATPAVKSVVIAVLGGASLLYGCVVIVLAERARRRERRGVHVGAAP